MYNGCWWVSGSISQSASLNLMSFTPTTQNLSGHTGIWYTAPRDASQMTTSLFVVGPLMNLLHPRLAGWQSYTQPIIIVRGTGTHTHRYKYTYIYIYIYIYICPCNPPHCFFQCLFSILSYLLPTLFPHEIEAHLSIQVLASTSLPNPPDRSRWPKRWRLPTMPRHKCMRACTFAERGVPG